MFPLEREHFKDIWTKCQLLWANQNKFFVSGEKPMVFAQKGRAQGPVSRDAR